MSAMSTRPVRGVKGAGTSEKNNYGKLSLHGLSKGQCCTTAVHTYLSCVEYVTVAFEVIHSITAL